MPPEMKIRKKGVITIVMTEQNVLDFIKQADVITKMHIIKRCTEAITVEDLQRLEDFLEGNMSEEDRNLLDRFKEFKAALCG